MTYHFKTCFKCDKEKPLDEYYKHKKMQDGRLNKCKECTKKDTRRNRAKRIDYYRKYDRQRSNLPKRVLGRKLYKMTDKYRQIHRESCRKWGEENKHKKQANRKVQNALLSGTLKKKPCHICGDDNLVHAHHHDYDKPLSVLWVCPQHHKDYHKTIVNIPI